MAQSRLIELSYFDPGSSVRLTAYADTIILDKTPDGPVITAIRFGGYPEMVRAMSDAIYGGGTIEARQNDLVRQLRSNPKAYRRQLSHDGVYASATLMVNDDAQSADPLDDEDPEESDRQQTIQPRKCYLFCPAGDRDRLFEELDHKSAAPLIPEFRDYVLDTLNPGRDIPWTKISGFGWVYKPFAASYMERTKNEVILERLDQIAEHPDGQYPVVGACRRFPLSTYIKKKYRGRINGFLCDELHEYNNNSGQGDAMAELFSVSKQFVGMTATLINGYSSGIFHLLYRIVPALMRKDGKAYRRPRDFDAEYGVVENVYELKDEGYNSNRRTNKHKQKSKQLPGVSPLVFSRFLLEYTAFLSLSDMGKDLPDYKVSNFLKKRKSANTDSPHKIQQLGSYTTKRVSKPTIIASTPAIRQPSLNLLWSCQSHESGQTGLIMKNNP